MGPLLLRKFLATELSVSCCKSCRTDGQRQAANGEAQQVVFFGGKFAATNCDLMRFPWDFVKFV